MAVAITKQDGNKPEQMPASKGTSQAQTNNSNLVPIKNIEFTVDELTVKKGTVVTWRNDDTALHDVVFDDANMSAANSNRLLKQGETHSYKFTEVGTFAYHCTPHPFMRAKIKVVE